MSKGLPILHKLPKFSTDFFHKSLPSTGTEFEKYSTATKYYEAGSTDLQLNRKNHNKPPLFLIGKSKVNALAIGHLTTSR